MICVRAITAERALRLLSTTGIGIALSIALSSCVSPSATKPAPTPTTSPAQQLMWQQQRAQVSTISAWQMRVRVAVTHGSEGGSATLHWQHQHARDKIQIYGPFGSGQVQITVHSGKAVLQDSKGNIIRGKSAVQVLQQRLGWYVPFTQLRDWLRGIPATTEAKPNFTLDQRGRLSTLQQNHWWVEYQKYQRVGEFDLPHKLLLIAQPGVLGVHSQRDIKSTRAEDEPLRVKIIVKNWQILSPSPEP